MKKNISDIEYKKRDQMFCCTPPEDFDWRTPLEFQPIDEINREFDLFPPDGKFRFCHLETCKTNEDALAMCETISSALEKINGTVVFYPDLNLWKCTFDVKPSKSFEVRMWRHPWGYQLSAARTTGNDLDNETNFEEMSDTIGPNETFFQQFCDAFDAQQSV